ncbi:MAG: endonuclease III [Bacilli bacterium]|nr:endonuclease III [Bacilli bacterium]
MNEIMLYLDKLIPNPACELNYTKDYELLIAVMLSAQTTDKRVNMVTKILFDKYPTLESLDKAELEDIINIIRSIGNYNKKALNIKLIANDLLIKSNGKVPNNREFLESLSGVGRKTTNVVLSNLFNEPCIAVDTHVARVSIRLGLAKPKDNVLVIEKKITKLVPVDRRLRIHHQLVLFGRYYCKAKKPLCKDCGLINICKEKQKSI